MTRTDEVLQADDRQFDAMRKATEPSVSQEP